MKELFLPKELSFMLKELGFNEICFGVYGEKFHFYDEYCGGVYELRNSNLIGGNSNHVVAPLYEQAVSYLEGRGYYINLFEEFELWTLMIHKYDENDLKLEIWGHKGPYSSKISGYNVAIQEIVKMIKNEI